MGEVRHWNCPTPGTVNAVKGGLEIPSQTGSDPILIADAAVIVSLDDGAQPKS